MNRIAFLRVSKGCVTIDNEQSNDDKSRIMTEKLLNDMRKKLDICFNDTIEKLNQIDERSKEYIENYNKHVYNEVEPNKSFHEILIEKLKNWSV